MVFSTFLAISVFAASAVAKHCQNFTVPVALSAQNKVFNIPTFQDSLDATTFIQQLTNLGQGPELASTGIQTITGTYNVSVKYCRPDTANATKPVLQFLVHGLGFDKRYWDSPYNNFNYSYVDVAVDQYGFSTFAIDRLGSGASSIVDPVNILQAPVELQVVYELTMMLRNGTIPKFDSTFSKIVHVGWSYGSCLVYDLAASHPGSSDGIVLTGFSLNDTYFPRIIAGLDFQLARLNQPLRWGNESYAAVAQALLIVGAANNSLTYINQNHPELGLTLADVNIALRNLNFGDLVAGFQGPILPTPLNLPSEYMTWADVGAFQYSFWSPEFFDPALLEYSEVTKQPFTPGELLTAGTGTTTAPNFKGPVLVISGNQDTVYCGGDCLATGTPNDLEKVGTAFPAAKAFEAYVQPSAGHAMNLHYNSTGAYKVIDDFLVAQGLGPS